MATHTPSVRFARSHDGIRLAYAASGQGPTLVKAATWLSHLAHDPAWQRARDNGPGTGPR